MRDIKIISELVMNLNHKFVINDHKGDWKENSVDYLIDRFYEELEEFIESIKEKDLKNAALEVADIALFAMFIVDKLRG